MIIWSLHCFLVHFQLVLKQPAGTSWWVFEEIQNHYLTWFSSLLKHVLIERQLSVPLSHNQACISLLPSCTTIRQHVPFFHENRQRMRANIKANILSIWASCNLVNDQSFWSYSSYVMWDCRHFSFTSVRPSIIKVNDCNNIANPVALAQSFHSCQCYFTWSNSIW